MTGIPATWDGGHALIVEFGDEELAAHCQCGAWIGVGTPATSLDEFGLSWERHVMGLVLVPLPPEQTGL